MEQRRFILFLTLSMAILIGWSMLFAPKPKPRPGGDPPAQADHADQGEAAKAGRPKPDAGNPQPEPEAEAVAQQDAASTSVESRTESSEKASADQPDDVQNGAEGEGQGRQPHEADPVDFAEHPTQTVYLGSVEPESGYFFRVTLSSKGGAVSRIEFNDPRFRDLGDPKSPLWIVGHTVKSPKTLETSVEAIDRLLAEHGTSLTDVDWEVAETTPDPENPKLHSAATFRFVSPDGTLEVLKTFRVKKVPVEGRNPRDVRDTEPGGYLLDFSLTVRNRSNEQERVRYDLQGPVGLPLENAENTQKFRDIRMAFLEDDGDVTHNSMAAADVAEAAANNALEEWQSAIKYIGVDIQYFAALLMPEENQLQTSYIDVARPDLVKGHRNQDRSDISVRLRSKEFSLAAGEELTHSYKLYAGPKRQALLEPLGASAVLDYGWFGSIAKLMMGLLNFLNHNVGIPYGIAIICLTVLVRGCMFPLSRKQAVGAKKMKELQPKIAELKKKYGNDKEKMARAQMELFSKHNYNPFAGCLPLLLQFPIFIGLYTALRNAVDLRMASFLWIDNLAAPDALFQMPFALPFLGEAFNLLPILSVGLFIFQQKMFMPPAAPDDEQAQMQQKMMTFLPIVFGFLFYRLPAGLCLYFVASSLWSMGERKMLDWTTSASGESAEPSAASSARKTESKKPKRNGLWEKLLATADAAQQQKSNGRGDSAKRPGDKKKKKSKSRR